MSKLPLQHSSTSEAAASNPKFSATGSSVVHAQCDHHLHHPVRPTLCVRLAVICQIPRAPKLNTKIQCICGAKQLTFSLWDTSNGIVDKKAKIALHTSHENLNDGGKCKARPKTAGWFRDDHQIIFLTHICWTGKESMTKSLFKTYI